MHYFKCSGSPEVRNRHFLRDYKNEFEHGIKRFEKTLKEEMNQSAENLREDLEASIELNRLSSQIGDSIKGKIQDTIEKIKVLSLPAENIRQSFDSLWTNVAEESLKEIHPKEKRVDLNIRASIQSVITTFLGPDYHRYHRKKSDSSKRIGMNGFEVKDSHLVRGKLTCLKERTETFIEQATDYCRRITEDKQYEAKVAEMLFNDILSQIKQLKEEGIDTSLDYKIDLIIYIEELAVKTFTLNQNKYEEKRSVPVILQKKKDIYYKVFVTKLGQRNSLVEMLLKSIIRDNLEDRLTPTDLLHILRVYGGEVFRGIKALQGSILIDLLAKNTFEGYLRYITNYKEVVKETLTRRSIEGLEKDNRLKLLAKSTLSRIIDELKLAIRTTVGSKKKDFIGTLFSNMQGLKKPHDDMEAYKVVSFDNKKKFGSLLFAQLFSIHKQFEKDIDSWAVSSIIHEKKFEAYAFNEIVGCKAKCPFCDVPCDAHSGGMMSANHNATFHIPLGLRGVVGTHLIAFNCTEGRTAKHQFIINELMKLENYRDVSTIIPCSDEDSDVYWKRVLRDFNEDFARYHKASKANIPHWWYGIQDHHVEEDLAKNYFISCDEIRRKLSEAKCKKYE